MLGFSDLSLAEKLNSGLSLADEADTWTLRGVWRRVQNYEGPLLPTLGTPFLPSSDVVHLMQKAGIQGMRDTKLFWE